MHEYITDDGTLELTTLQQCYFKSCVPVWQLAPVNPSGHRQVCENVNGVVPDGMQVPPLLHGFTLHAVLMAKK